MQKTTNIETIKAEIQDLKCGFQFDNDDEYEQFVLCLESMGQEKRSQCGLTEEEFTVILQKAEKDGII